jgi:hypothetical protein
MCFLFSSRAQEDGLIWGLSCGVGWDSTWVDKSSGLCSFSSLCLQGRSEGKSSHPALDALEKIC